jgi:hypothetical protein
MADRKPLVLINGDHAQIPNNDTIIAGAGITSAGTNDLTLSSATSAVKVASGKTFDVPGAINADGGIGRSSNGTLEIGTDPETTSITVGAPGTPITFAGNVSVPNTSVSGLTTTGLTNGDFGYVSTANVVSKTDSVALASSRVLGVNTGVVGSLTISGTIAAAKFTTAGGAPTAGGAVFLAAGTDDTSTGAGKLTATPPTTGVSVKVGVCLDPANYASAKTAKIELDVQQLVIL